MNEYIKLCEDCSDKFLKFRSKNSYAMAHANCRYVELKLEAQKAVNDMHIKQCMNYQRMVNDELE